MAWANQENHYNDERVSSACGLFGFMDTTGQRHDGQRVFVAINAMKERGNGLGAGFAVYGLYPEWADYYAFHIMCRDEADRREVEEYLRRYFHIAHSEPIPHTSVRGVEDVPMLWRYFVAIQEDARKQCSEEEAIIEHVMRINSQMAGAFVFSSGKNMGIFKGVGHPEQIIEFYRLDTYQGYMWTAHNRFPTNTPGWWGGAHPFGLLDWSVVHNGEISSYGINRRYLEMHGYLCTMRTDTEVVAYAADLVMRRHGLTPEWAAAVFASPLWNEIEAMPEPKRAMYRAIRQTYGPLLLNGPFTVIIARTGQMIGLGDRIRLRPLVAGIKGESLYISSELSAIYLAEPAIEHTWTPFGGDAVVAQLGLTPVPPPSPRLEEEFIREVNYA